MTPAEELRTAAKLMRERVQGATAGPWTVREEHGRDIADEGWSDVRVVRPGAGVAITYLSNVLEGSPHEDNAAYIASMHPGVALAVADWLEAEADRAAEIDGFEDSASYPLMLAGFRHSLAVARAYLGEPDE